MSKTILLKYAKVDDMVGLRLLLKFYYISISHKENSKYKIKYVFCIFYQEWKTSFAISKDIIHGLERGLACNSQKERENVACT